MKYIKYFESLEFTSSDIKELEDFCNDYLAYLIDDGFDVRIRHGSNNSRVRIEFYKGKPFDPTPFDWDDVKDIYIPFFHMLSEEYKISLTTGYHRLGEMEWVNNASVIFNYIMPGKNLWDSGSALFTKDNILNNDLSGYAENIGTITVYLEK